MCASVCQSNPLSIQSSTRCPRLMRSLSSNIMLWRIQHECKMSVIWKMLWHGNGILRIRNRFFNIPNTRSMSLCTDSHLHTAQGTSLLYTAIEEVDERKKTTSKDKLVTMCKREMMGYIILLLHIRINNSEVEWVLIATCKQLVWSSRIGRNLRCQNRPVNRSVDRDTGLEMPCCLVTDLLWV